MADDLNTLARTALFEGIPPREIPSLLRSIGAEERAWRRGETIREAGDEMDFFGIVLEGAVQASIPQNGRMQIVGRFGAGESFAEAAPVAFGRTPVTIVAVEDARIICIAPAALKESPSPHAFALQANLTSEMSKKLLHLSSKLAILGEPRLRKRVLMYLDSCEKQPDGSVAVGMSYRELADYLGVNNTALSRELGRMQDEGVIRMGKHSITVLKTEE